MKAPLGWMVGVAAIVAAMRVSTGPDAPGGDTLTVRRLTVADPAGRFRIELGVTSSGCDFSLIDGREPRVRLSIDSA